MRINTKQLMGLPVETEGGASIGKVCSADVETETGRIIAIHAKTRGVIPGLMDEDLLIAWSQIVEITAEHVIVQDATVPEGARVFADTGRSVAMGGAQFSERM
jgi:sporulation protein YlmC with PRC-barrel domain